MTTVLFVCTANICRSPYAQAALAAELGSSHNIKAVSAGARTEWLQVAGEPACPEMPYGRELRSGAVVRHSYPHEARQLDVALVREADIIIAFEQAHRAAVIDLVPRAQTKLYTARQIQRLARAVSSPMWPDFAPARSGDLVKDFNGARSWAPFAADEDITDPHGGGTNAHHACADEIDGIVADLISVFADSPNL